MKLIYSLTLLGLIVAMTNQNSKADIVYSGANQNITYGFQGTLSLFGDPGSWDDIRLQLLAIEDPSQKIYQFQNMLQVHGNYVGFVQGTGSNVKRLNSGDSIGASDTFLSNNSYNNFSSYSWMDLGFGFPFINENGEFRNQTGYAGLRMVNGADTYFGWMQITVSNYNNSAMTATLVDWAYERTPGTSILAGATITPVPEPSSALLLLAGLALLNRRRRIS